MRSRGSISSRVSCINTMWTRLPYVFYINLLIPIVIYVVFINEELTAHWLSLILRRDEGLAAHWVNLISQEGWGGHWLNLILGRDEGLAAYWANFKFICQGLGNTSRHTMHAPNVIWPRGWCMCQMEHTPLIDVVAFGIRWSILVQWMLPTSPGPGDVVCARWNILHSSM